MAFVCVYQPLLVFAPALYGFARDVVHNNIFNGICLGAFTLNDVENVFFVDGVVFKDMFPYAFGLLFENSHLFLITQHADNIIASYDAQFGEQRLNHLQMPVVHPIKHYGVNVFKYNMLLYQCRNS